MPGSVRGVRCCVGTHQRGKNIGPVHSKSAMLCPASTLQCSAQPSHSLASKHRTVLHGYHTCPQPKPHTPSLRRQRDCTTTPHRAVPPLSHCTAYCTAPYRAVPYRTFRARRRQQCRSACVHHTRLPPHVPHPHPQVTPNHHEPPLPVVRHASRRPACAHATCMHARVQPCAMSCM